MSVIERKPPSAEESELSLFGAVILSPSFIDTLSPGLGAKFFDVGLGRAFELVCDLHRSGQRADDLTAVVRQLKAAELYQVIGGSATIAKACNQSLAHNAPWHVAEIEKTWKLREQWELGIALLKETQEPNSDPMAVCSSIESTLARLTQQSVEFQIDELESMVVDAVEEIKACQRRGRSLGVPTGLSTLDEITGGLFKGELTVLAARPSIGKTALAMEILTRMIESGYRVLFVSLEMNRHQLAHRFLSRETGIPVKLIQSGQLTTTELSQIFAAKDRLRSFKFKAFTNPNSSVNNIHAAARLMRSQGGIDVLAIDYLGLIDMPGRMSQYERITAISRQVKLLAGSLEIPVLCLAQLSREASKADKPALEHLRDSGAIEQDADNVWLLHRERRDSEEAELIVAKQRQGAVGLVSLGFDPVRMSFDCSPLATNFVG